MRYQSRTQFIPALHADFCYQWFDRQKGYLDSLEAQLRGLVKAIELVAKQRSDLAAATGEFAQAITELSACDIEKQLAHSLAGLAEVGRKAQELQSAQSSQDVVTLMSTGKLLLVRRFVCH
jgi:sorting nexin-1/2